MKSFLSLFYLLLLSTTFIYSSNHQNLITTSTSDDWLCIEAEQKVEKIKTPSPSLTPTQEKMDENILSIKTTPSQDPVTPALQKDDYTSHSNLEDESDGYLSDDEKNFENKNPDLTKLIKKKIVNEQVPSFCSELVNCFGPCFPWLNQQPKKKHE